MTGLLLLTGSILIIAVFALVYRILSLIEIAKGKQGKQQGAGMSNTVNSVLLALFFFAGFGLIFWYSGKASENFLPEAASEHGKLTDKLFWITTGITFVVFFLTHAILLLSPYFFRYRETRKALWWPDNTKLEVAWTILPAIVLTILVLTGWWAWRDITAPAPDDSLQVEIVGKQFNWIVRYGGKDGKIGKYDYRKIDATNQLGMDFAADKSNFDDFIPREIHLPKGKSVLLKIRARDVLHSVFLPHFRVKMDAVPGMPTSFWFTPTKTTEEMRKELNDPNFNYELACTEICGQGHFAMRMVVVVSEPEEFEKWYASQEPWAKQNADYIASLNLENSQELASLFNQK